MEKPGHGREAAHAAKSAIRLSLPYRGDGVKTMTTDNSNGFSTHRKITEAMKGTAACFADPALRGRKVSSENADKFIRQYVPEGTDFGDPGNSFQEKSIGQDKRKAKGETQILNAEMRVLQTFL